MCVNRGWWMCVAESALPAGPLLLPHPSFPVAVRATSQGGDLMSDLFNKLVMRRKGRRFWAWASLPPTGFSLCRCPEARAHPSPSLFPSRHLWERPRVGAQRGPRRSLRPHVRLHPTPASPTAVSRRGRRGRLGVLGGPCGEPEGEDCLGPVPGCSLRSRVVLPSGASKGSSKGLCKN